MLCDIEIDDGSSFSSQALSSENSQRIQLQEQLETLAKQHSSLERAAAREGGSGGGGGGGAIRK